MTKKALIILFTSIGGALVVAGSTTAIIINNSTTYVDDPTADATSFVYNGSEQTYTLKESELYTITGNKKTDAGEYSVVVSLNKKDKYAWKSTKKNDDLIFNFTIDKKGVLEPSSDTSLFEYTGNEITYTVTSEDSSFYTVTNNKATNAGTYNAIVSLNDTKNYKWKNSNKSDDLSLPFTISQKDVSSLIEIDDIDDIEYTGEHINPNITLKTAIPEYEIAYGENINVGKGTVTITAKGNFKGSKTFEFNIIKKKISIPTPTTTEYSYTGSEIIHIIPESEYYDISNNKATNAGNYSATLSLKDKTNTIWSDGTNDDKELNFKINPITILESNVQNINNEIYTGQEIIPEVNIAINNYTLIKDTDYELSYSNNINAGIASVTIIGKDNYTGTVIKTFNIGKKTPTVTAPTPVSNLRQTGADYELVTAGSTSDGTMQYALALDGTYTATIPTGNNAGEYKVYYKVVGNENIEDVAPQYVTVTIAKPYAEYTAPVANNLTYIGSEQPLVTAGTTSHGTIEYSLDGENYSDSIPNGTNASEYTVYFRIVPDDDHDSPETAPVIVTISEAQSSYTVEPTVATLKYNAAPQTLIGNVPVAVGGDIFYSLDENGEFTSTIPTGTNPGEYKVYYYIKSDSNHLDSEVKYVTATISKLDIADTSISISSIQNQTYTGSDLTPSITITLGTYTLVNDTDYELSYSNNKNAGSATITITGLGYFEGTTSTTFTIDKMEIEVPTLTSVVYNAEPQTPVISSTYYELDDSTYSQTNVSNYQVALTLTDSENTKWAGSNLPTIDADWSITAGSLNDATITGLSQEYAKTGSQLDIAPIITYNGVVLDNVDFNIYITTKDDTSTQLPYVIDVGNYILFIEDGVNLEGSYQFEFFVSTNEHNISGATVTGLTNQTYTGSAIEPIPTVTFDSTTLILGTDYTLNYSNNIDVGTATIEIVGMGNYLSSKAVTFEIVPLGIDDSNITVSDVADQTYTGSDLTPSVTITFNSTNLEQDTDFTVSYSNNVSAGTATITITGIGNFTGSRTTTFTINKKQIATPTLQSVYYDATAKTPSIAANLAYELDDPTFNRTNAGDYQVTLTLKDTSNTKWLDTNNPTIDVTWTINKLNINVLTFENVESAYQETINGDPITITPVIKLNSTVLDNSEFTIWYTDRSTPVVAKDPIEPGNYYIWFSGVNFTGSTNLQFTINKNVYDINDTEIQAIADQTYTGSAITPNLVITHESRLNPLVKGTDYTVSATSNTNVGTATITITGIGDFKNTKQVTFTIVAKDIASEDITVGDISNKTYTGSAITVLNSEIVVNQNNLLNPLINDTDYTVSYSNNVDAGTATITITGIGNYTGTRTKYFTIDPKSIASATVSEIADMKYEGSPLTPEPTVTDGTTALTKNTDYTLSYDNNSASGTATITITGINNYGSFKEVTFRVYLYEISDADIAAIANQAFTGSAVTPALTITHSSNPLTVNTDYTVTYSNNINASNTTNNPDYAVATIKGKGDFGGETTANFTILPKDLSKQDALNNYVITISIPDYDYTGSVITPTITIIDTERNNNLLAPTDYAVQYDKTLQAVDTYTATISGTNNYTGSRQVTFDINSLDIADATVSPISNQVYTGNPVTPTNFTVTHNNHVLTNGVDYSLSYTDNTDIGTATVTITGIGNYTGSKNVTFEIIEVVLTFNITYDIPAELQGATNPNNTTTITSTVLKVTPLTLDDLTISTDAGYSFAGWTLGTSNIVVDEINISNATNNGTLTQTEYTYDLLVVAHSSLNTYNVTYMNLHNATVANTTFTVESNTITLPAPSVNATEATFNGWTTGSVGGTPITTIPASSVGNITVYANWTYNEYQITYNLDGGTNPITNKGTVTYYDSFNLVNPTKDYYTFQGWYETYSGGVYSNPITSISNTTDDKTLYAKWELTQYTITYNYSIASNLVTNKSANPTTYYYNYNSGTISLVNMIAYTYRFDGFYESSNYSGTPITTIDTTTPENKILYAKFTSSNTTFKTYLNNEESNAPGSVTSNMSSKVVGEEVTFTATANIGYSFLGWYNSSDQFMQADPALTFTLTTDTVVYKAKYFAYTLTYRTESSTKGSVSSNVYGATAGTAKAVSANTSVTLTASTNNGYTFIGWYDTSNDSKVSSSLIYTFNMPASSIVYEARWVSVSTQSNDTTLGTVNSLNGKYVADDNITLTATPTTGNIFNGWYVDNVLVESNATYQTTMPNVDTVFVARFITNYITPVNTLLDYTEDESVYTFTYTQINDITATATHSINGSTITYTMASDPNYIFAGWWSTADNTRELLSESISYSFSMEAPVNEKYVYALWINPEHVSTYRNPQVDGLVITRSFGLVTDGITATATTNNQDYNWVGWYHNNSLYDSGNTTLTLTYAQTFEKLVTMTSFNGIDITYEARWNISGIVVEVSETLGNGLGSVNKTDNGNSTWTITATPDAGYAFDHWEHEGSTYSTNATVNNVPTDSGTYYAYFTARNDIDYTSNVKLQNYEDNNYTDTTTVIPNNTTNTKVYISAPATPEGYELANVKVNGINASPISSGTNAGKYELTILGDGSSQIDFYFDLLTIDITYHYNNGTQSSTVTEKYNTSTSSYAIASIANVTWYSDINLTSQVTTLDINATDIDLYACYDGNNNLSTKFDLTGMTGYYKVEIKDGSFSSTTDIVIPDYIEDIAVKKVNVDNLYGETYNSITMPTGLEIIEYGTYSWIVLGETSGTYTLLSENLIGNKTKFDENGTAQTYEETTIKNIVEGLVTTYGTDSIALLDETTYTTYQTIIDANPAQNKEWWLLDVFYDDENFELWVSYMSLNGLNSSSTGGEDGYNEKLYIRPLLIITL